MASPTGYTLEIAGLLYEKSYHIARVAGEAIESNPLVSISYHPMIETEWRIFLQDKRKALGDEMWEFRESAGVISNGKFVGGAMAFLTWVKENFDYEEFRPAALYEAMAKEAFQDFIKNSKHDFVFMAITLGDKLIGRLVLELYSDLCPKACENFRTLCTSQSTEAGISYRGSVFHRVVKNGWVQGGDTIDGSGGHSVSIYNGHFEDESFALRHDCRGILGMANEGPHTNGSQFYFTFKPCPWLDKESVAFGRVMIGWDVLQRLEEVDTFNERPTDTCRISSCGMWAPP